MPSQWPCSEVRGTTAAHWLQQCIAPCPVTQAEAIARELREAYASLPPLPPDPEAAQYDVPPPDEVAEGEAAAAEGQAADVDAAEGQAAEAQEAEAAAAAAAAEDAEQQGGAEPAAAHVAKERQDHQQQAAAAAQGSQRQAAVAEVPGEPGPPLEADRPGAPSEAHTEL